MILPAKRPLRPRPIITITTDFGLSDHYVGTMKGVLLSRCPDAVLVDISHQVKPFAILEGAYTISQAAPYFPASTVHLVVVDPGVGTQRKAVAVAARGQLFVAPDNGVLSLVLDGQEYEAFAIENRDFMLEQQSSTFHGRDVFAPAAAMLAGSDVPISDAGGPLKELVQLPDLNEHSTVPGVWRGRILSVDQFGNVITNFSNGQHKEIATAPFELLIASMQIRHFRRTFGEADSGPPFVYFGSSGFLEIGVNQGSAANLLHVHAGEEALLHH